jgi:exosome complex component RRP42
LKSEGDEDPLFDDDWAAAVPLYSQKASGSKNQKSKSKSKRKAPTQAPRLASANSFKNSLPPVTLLVISVGRNIIFDPSAEEIAAAETVVAITVAEDERAQDETHSGERSLSLRALRMIDPPSRVSQPGVALDGATQLVDDVQGVWKPPKGGVRREVISRMVKMVLEKGGVAEEVLAGLDAVIDDA